MTYKEQLAKRIQDAATEYHNGRPSPMSDSAWDAAVEELKTLDPSNPVLTQIGAPPETGAFAKVRHAIPRSSLNKVHTEEELAKWAQFGSDPEETGGNLSVPKLFWSEKADGISIELVYADGVFTSASTRGDGEWGVDITRNVRLMKGVKLHVPLLAGTGLVYIPGEVVVTHEDFKNHFPGEANPRNTAAGTAKRQSDNSKCRHLTVLTYNFMPSGLPMDRQSDEFAKLDALGFQTVRHGHFWGQDQLAQLGALRDHYGSELRANCGYEIDGIVVTVDSSDMREQLGMEGGNPAGSVAFKFPPDSGVTGLLEIRPSVGKSGRVTPVSFVEPIILAKATVVNPNLHNYGKIAELARQAGRTDGCLCVGDRLVVSRRGDVMPHIEACLGGGTEPIPTPTECPACAGDLTMDGAYLVCQSDDCPAQVAGAIRRWVEKIGVLDVGPALIAELVDQGKVETIADMYRLTFEDVIDLRSEDGRSIRTAAEKAILNLKAKRTMTLATLVGSLGISLCGRSTVRTIVEAGYDDLGRLLSIPLAKLLEIPGIGPERANSFWGAIFGKKELIFQLIEAGVVVEKPKTGHLTGTSFCFTGFRIDVRNGVNLVDALAAKGATIKDNVGRDLRYLVAKDPAKSTGKLAKAGPTTQIITVDKAWELANE